MAIGDFEMTDRDGLARLGRLETAHGTIRTPTLMPVVNPNITVVPPKRIRELGGEVIITNSYVILKRVELREAALSGGVHKLVGWEGPLMTDSGTFQSYVYGDVDVKPAEIVGFQRDIGSDIGTALDVFSVPDLSPEKAASHVDETLARVKATLSLAGEKMILAATVQGSTHPAQRRRAAEGLSTAGARYLAFGGVVPLMESYRFSELVDAICAAKAGANPAAPVHLFGCGHPMLFPLAALLGCDLFDSAAYHKYGRDGRMMTPTGTVSIEDLRENPCHCEACGKSTPEELRAAPAEERERRLTEHNLIISFAEIRRVRQAIAEESLWELVETRCRAHPALLSALRRLPAHAALLDAHEPLSRRGALYYTGPESLDRPAVRLFRQRVEERFRPHGGRILLLVDETVHPYRESLRPIAGSMRDAAIIVRSPLGPVPFELEGVYPACQSVFPDALRPEKEAEESTTKLVDRLRSGYSATVESLEALAGQASGEPIDRDTATVAAISDHQFGAECTDLLLKAPLRFVKSRLNDRVRNVYSNEEHVLSVRAFDGLCSLKTAGAARLVKTGLHQVTVSDDAAPFVTKGKNVFAKFVVKCHPEVRPGDETIVIDERGELLAVGKSAMTPAEMRAFSRGIAVNVRDSVGSGDAREEA